MSHLIQNLHFSSSHANTEIKSYIAIRLAQLQILGRVGQEAFHRVDFSAARRTRRDLKLELGQDDGGRLLFNHLTIQRLRTTNNSKSSSHFKPEMAWWK